VADEGWRSEMFREVAESLGRVEAARDAIVAELRSWGVSEGVLAPLAGLSGVAACWRWLAVKRGGS
jgi:hypothetical protein